MPTPWFGAALSFPRRFISASAARLPRWYPSVEELVAAPAETFLALRAETATRIERTVLTLLGVGTFCALALQSPDSLLLSEQPSVQLPLVEGEVSLGGFLVAGPLLLIGVWLHLHVLMHHRRLENRALRIRSLRPPPGWADARHPFIIGLAGLAYLVLVPVVLANFSYKAAGLPGYGGPMTLVLFIVLWGHVLAVAGWIERQRLRLIAIVTLSAVLLAAGWQGWPRLRGWVRPLNLYRADLAGAFLPSAHLRGANLARADLEGAVLIDADLTGAYFGNARLAGADLTRAKLEGAEFRWSDLRKATLTQAKLAGTTFLHVDLRDANLVAADLSGSAFRGADCAGANFEFAALNDAFVENSIFRGARFHGASLQGVTDNAAILGGPSLSAAKGVELSADQRRQIAVSGGEGARRPIYDRNGMIIGYEGNDLPADVIDKFFGPKPVRTEERIEDGREDRK